MKLNHARGVQVFSQLVQDLSRLDPDGAKAIVDGLSDEEVSNMLAAAAGSNEALGERDVFEESFAERLERTETEEARQ